MKSSEGDVERMGDAFGGSGLQTLMGGSKVTGVEHRACGWIAGCALHVGVVQAELGERDGDSCSVLVGGAWTVGWVLPKCCSTEALTRTQPGKGALPTTHRYIGWLGECLGWWLGRDC